MLSITTNTSSLIAQNSLKTSTNILNQAIERMSTGSKINHAKDNAANYSIATNMTTKINALQVAEDNVNMGLDMLLTAEESVNQISQDLLNLRKLAIQSNNGTYAKSLSAINAEATAILSNIEKTYKNTTYNNINLFYKDSMVDNPNRVAKQTSFVSGETYYITDSQDLVALQNLVNSGVDTTKVNFELTSDIDMSGVKFRGIGIDETNSFKGNLDGKGHIIANLSISCDEQYVGLFGVTKGAVITNLGMENSNIEAKQKYTASLVGLAMSSTITSCYVKGNITGGSYVGGLVGVSRSSHLKNLYFEGRLQGAYQTGGIVGMANQGGTFSNCYSQGTVIGGSDTGGCVGANFDGVVINKSFSTCDVTVTGSSGGGLVGSAGSGVKDSFSTGKVTGTNTVGGFAGYYQWSFSNCACSIDSYSKPLGGGSSNPGIDMLTIDEIKGRYTPEVMGFTEENGWKIVGDRLLLDWQKENKYDSLSGKNEVSLQCGTSAESSSSVGFNLSFVLGDIGEILENGLDNPLTIDLIDKKIKVVDSKATEYGTLQNRLQSVLDEISIQYENLISSRSTIKDADISDVSSEYIRQQILQQASATLIATANQTPALALQLL